MSAGGSRLILWGALALVFVAATLIGMMLTLNAHDQRVPASMILGGSVGEEVRETLSGAYLASQVALQRQDFEAAAQYAEQTQGLGGVPEKLALRNLRLLIAAGKMEASQTLAAGLKTKDDALVRLVNIGRLVDVKEYSAALGQLEGAPSGGLYQLIRPVIKAWLQAGEAKQSGKVLPADALLKGDLEGKAFLATFMRYQRALMLDWLAQTDDARADYEIIAAKPEVAPYRMAQAMANFYLRRGELKAAENIYANYIEHNPDAELKPPALPESVKAAKATSPLIAGPKDGLAEIYFTAASLLFGERVHQETIIYLRLALTLRPDFPPAQMLLANLFEQREQFEEAVAVYQAIDTDSVFFKQGRLRIALNYHAAGRAEQAIELLQRMVADEPDNEEAINLLGDVFRREERFRESALVFEHALKASPETEWSWSFYYKYGMALERSQRWDQGEAMFEKALSIEENQPDVLNYLGYSWLEQGKKLEEAKALIERAYVRRPDQAHIIDSMGWAHYKLSEYDRALPLLEEAALRAPHDPTVNDHLGDIYWKLGRKREARFQWERALTFEPEDASAIQRKLEHGLQAQ